jgi:hypothetical protein
LNASHTVVAGQGFTAKLAAELRVTLPFGKDELEDKSESDDIK